MFIDMGDLRSRTPEGCHVPIKLHAMCESQTLHPTGVRARNDLLL